MNPALYSAPVLAVAVGLLIRAGVLGKRRHMVILKPLSTLLVITVALLSLLRPVHSPTYTVGVTVGLVLSLGGDIALLFEEHRKAFAVGLGLFLLAHATYAVVFTLLGRVSPWDVLSIAVLLGVGAGFYVLIRSNLGRMTAPVIIYMLVISAMVSRAAATLVSFTFSAAQVAMILAGALLFYLSDGLLAANRFWKPWRYRRIGLAPYYAGQFLIALAASYFVP